MRVFTYLWEFKVKPEFSAEFAQAYGPDGDWARLFRRSPAYLGTHLHRDVADPLRFITVDHWRTREDHATFQHLHGVDYAAIDARCEAYTEDERLIGHFVAEVDMHAWQGG